VGNRVTVFDLVNNKSHTLPFAHRTNISRIALHPKGQLLLTIDEQGHAILSHYLRRVVLYHFSLRGAVSTLEFSPSGTHFAVGLGRKIEVWKTPSTPGSTEGDNEGGLEFAPFVKYREYVGHHDTVQNIEWSSDSRFFLSSSKDLTARIWSLDPEEGFTPTILAGHRTAVYAAWFSADQETIYTISKDGALFQWRYLPSPEADPEDIAADDERWRIAERNYFFQDQAHLTTASFHASSNLLVTGFSNGVFMLHELPGFSEIHKLSISASNIDTVSINRTGEWLAFGSSALGQLLVWEWQSESYILKHSHIHHRATRSLLAQMTARSRCGTQPVGSALLLSPSTLLELLHASSPSVAMSCSQHLWTAVFAHLISSDTVASAHSRHPKGSASARLQLILRAKLLLLAVWMTLTYTSGQFRLVSCWTSFLAMKVQFQVWHSHPTAALWSRAPGTTRSVSGLSSTAHKHPNPCSYNQMSLPFQLGPTANRLQYQRSTVK
jgi:WD40 repeat protein